MHSPGNDDIRSDLFYFTHIAKISAGGSIASVDRLKIELSSRKAGVMKPVPPSCIVCGGETVTLERLTILQRHGLCWFRLRTNSVAARLPESIAE